MKTLQRLWSALHWQSAKAIQPTPEVIIHDPDASKPHDLDDPFFDNKVRERIGSVIARATQH